MKQAFLYSTGFVPDGSGAIAHLTTLLALFNNGKRHLFFVFFVVSILAAVEYSFPFLYFIIAQQLNDIMDRI